MPVLTMDLTVGTKKMKKLNLSHNAIADIRPGIVLIIAKMYINYYLK